MRSVWAPQHGYDAPDCALDDDGAALHDDPEPPAATQQPRLPPLSLFVPSLAAAPVSKDADCGETPTGGGDYSSDDDGVDDGADALRANASSVRAPGELSAASDTTCSLPSIRHLRERSRSQDDVLLTRFAQQAARMQARATCSGAVAGRVSGVQFSKSPRATGSGSECLTPRSSHSSKHKAARLASLKVPSESTVGRMSGSYLLGLLRSTEKTVIDQLRLCKIVPFTRCALQLTAAWPATSCAACEALTVR